MQAFLFKLIAKFIDALLTGVALGFKLTLLIVELSHSLLRETELLFVLIALFQQLL